MASKKIRIKEDVYNKLKEIKREDESFSDLFLRLLNSQKQDINELLGSWDLSEGEKRDIWDPITKREGRKWKKPIFED
jgi:predicted CopG family antitoxin